MTTVLHTIDTWGPGGAETICVELARGLAAGQLHSVAAVLREGWVYEAMRARAIDTTIVRQGSGGFDLRYLGGLARVARRHRASIIQSHLLAANLYGGVVARMLGVVSVATFHGMVDIDPADRRAQLKLRLIAANAARIVFVSEALRRYFREQHAVAEHRTIVIPNGIDPERFRRARNRMLRDQLKLPDDVVLIGAVGNVRPAKGYDDLLRVAAILRQAHARVHFIVVGEPGERIILAVETQRWLVRLMFGSARPQSVAPVTSESEPIESPEPVGTR